MRQLLCNQVCCVLFGIVFLEVFGKTDGRANDHGIIFGGGLRQTGQLLADDPVDNSGQLNRQIRDLSKLLSATKDDNEQFSFFKDIVEDFKGLLSQPSAPSQPEQHKLENSLFSLSILKDLSFTFFIPINVIAPISKAQVEEDNTEHHADTCCEFIT